MSKEHQEAETLAALLTRVLGPILDRLEKLESASKPNVPDVPAGVDTADEHHYKLMAALRGQDQGLERFKLVEVVEGCLSDTGATFDAEVHYPPLRKEGKIVGRDPTKGLVKVLLNYQWPDGIDRHVRDGGVVPDGMEMKEVSGLWIGQETDAYRQWKWDEFMKADNKRYVGKPLPGHIRRVQPTAPVAQAV